ncbi:uracil-DNA glycosylase-like isoform X1 [Watersipora subatra]|uniref:uracil-DNA glycosylase-like isoform X1 n=1 Tax=Watersipora subatra TaxID=2589382 RepID=UPI00355BD776
MANQTKLSSFFSVKTSSPLAQKSRNVDILTPTKRALTSNEAKGSKKLKENNPTATVLSTITSPKVVSFAPKTNGLVTRFGLSWKPCLEKEFAKDYFQKLSEFVKQEKTKHTIYPKIEDVFAWTTACRLNDVKVVILGQDPYHGVNQAHGLCFSVPPGVAMPPSLQNIYKELASDIPGFKAPNHGYLMGWAQQGVLLLNSVLTVRAGLANSHKDKGWETLTDAVIHYLNTNTTNTVFILWGSYAQKKGGHINKSKHCVLKGVHPSPLAAHRGFFGCKHFSQANKYLQTHNKSPVDWNLLPAQS